MRKILLEIMEQLTITHKPLSQIDYDYHKERKAILRSNLTIEPPNRAKCFNDIFSDNFNRFQTKINFDEKRG
jgi:hypothetical protein